jgi:hypothetical protein
MKPSSWYASMLVVVFLYLYVLAVQYIRAEELQAHRGTSQITFDDGTGVETPYAKDLRDPFGSVTSVGVGSISDAGQNIFANEHQGGSLHSVGVGSSSDVSPSQYPSSVGGDRELGIGSSSNTGETPSIASYISDASSYPSESVAPHNSDNAGSLRAVGNVGLDRAVGSSYRPGYSYDPSYNNHNQFYSGGDSLSAAAANINSHRHDGSYTLDFKYHNYDKLTKFLRTTSSKFPNLTALYSIGKSVQGKKIVCDKFLIAFRFYTGGLSNKRNKLIVSIARCLLEQLVKKYSAFMEPEVLSAR